MDLNDVKVNGTVSDALTLTLHSLFDSDDDDDTGEEKELPVPLSVVKPSLVNGESVRVRVNESSSNEVVVSGVECEEEDERSVIRSSELSTPVAKAKNVGREEDKEVRRSPRLLTTPGAKNNVGSNVASENRKSRGDGSCKTLALWTDGENKGSVSVRRSPRLSTPVTVPQPKRKKKETCEVKRKSVSVERGNERFEKLGSDIMGLEEGRVLELEYRGEVKSSKKQKVERECCFVGEAVSEAEAMERWGWRYELKAKRRKGQGWILNAGGEDEVHLNVECHYLQANVGGCIFSLGDCVHIKGEEKQPLVGKILEFFKTSDDQIFFRVQWYFRAEDTVLKQAAAYHDKKRLFYSTLMNDNLLDCILSKVRIIEKDPSLGFLSTSIQSSEYYCDMEYSVKYSTFRSLVTATKCDLTMPSGIGANNIDITTTPVALTGCEMYKSELALLDLYAGCGGMSTGLCLGAKISGVKLVTRWAVDYHKSACDSLKLNHPETEVRHTTAEDFLELLKEWEKPVL